MRILFISDVSIDKVTGGAERVLYEQSTRLADRGYLVHILTRHLPQHRSAHEIRRGVHEWRFPVISSNQPMFFVSTLRNAGALFRSLHNEFNYSCLIAHQPYAAFAAYRIAAQRSIKKIYICHSLSFEEFISRNPKPVGLAGKVMYALNVVLRKKTESSVLRASDPIIALSQYTRDKLQRVHAINANKIKLIPGGVDVGRFFPAGDKSAIRRQLGVPENRIILVTVRNLVNRMGLENLIRAMDRVRQTFHEVFLVIGGDGPLMDSLTAQAARLGLGNHIRFEGFIPEDQLPDYYRMADLFVLPTLDLEGFGLVTLEAMASGVPVLGTPVGGTNEILGRFDPDFLFADHTPAAMADRINAVCRMIKESPLKWEDISKRCRRFAAVNYGWDQHISALENIINPKTP
jgi:glycosyltransferase involved in cell wall biosynthesis